ncbi:MAG: hypothetical protein KatS3mg110_1649 [Pirellulaceae bacterium]|nr:MAG: hypothetical protein KatS3mg110_1649 [Pirellulaceae bacterium]
MARPKPSRLVTLAATIALAVGPILPSGQPCCRQPQVARTPRSACCCTVRKGHCPVATVDSRCPCAVRPGPLQARHEPQAIAQRNAERRGECTPWLMPPTVSPWTVAARTFLTATHTSFSACPLSIALHEWLCRWTI